MNMKLKPYSEYQDVGLPWLGRIPAHWQIERGKWLFQCMNRPVFPDDEVVTCFRDGTVTLRKNRRTSGFTESLKEIGYQGVRRGDLVIHAMDAFAGAIGVSDSDGKCTPVYAVCRPRRILNSEYYARVAREMARSQWIVALARGIRERSTDFRFETFAGQFVPVPPVDEQNAIAQFLHYFDYRIHRFIQAKQQLIKLITEQKQGIIHQAVTRGLDPAVNLKPSGIPWVGDIPEHWEVRRAKQLCLAIIDCKNRTPDLVPDGEYTVVRTTNVRNGRFNLTGSYTTDRRNYEIWTQRGAPQVGDVFFTREAPAGEACLVPNIPNLCMGQRMMYFRPDPRQLDPRFLLLSIYGPVVRTYIEHACNGSTVGHLRLGQVAGMPLLWCPVEEQINIANYVEEICAPLNEVIFRAEREIGLVLEYHRRVVADVVTGKVDVSNLMLPSVSQEEHLMFPEDGEVDGSLESESEILV